MRLVREVFDIAVDFYFFAIVARALMSWIRPQRPAPWYRRLAGFLWRITEPVLEPIRRVIPPHRLGIDISPFVAVVLLDWFSRIARRLLLRLE